MHVLNSMFSFFLILIIVYDYMILKLEADEYSFSVAL